MTTLTLTKAHIKQGVWHGILTKSGAGEPKLEVTHQETIVPDVALTLDEAAGHWAVTIPIPLQAIADGVQTLIISDATTQTAIGQISLMAGEVLGDDMRVEVDLLRAELDLLKRAFRRHCLETT